MRMIAVAAIASTLVATVAQPARADIVTPSRASCLAGAPSPGGWARLWQSNYLTTTSSPSAMLDHDAFRITSPTSTHKIDYWGTNKSVNGELPVAPSGWPAPGEPRYMVIARINQGTMWVQNRSRTFAANEWFPVGSDSGCLLYHGPGLGTFFTFSVNDTNLGDNSGWIGNVFGQWW